MKKLHLPTVVVTVIGLAVTIFLMAQSSAPKLIAQEEDHRYSQLENIFYYKNASTGRIGINFIFELEPNHVYKWQATRDGVTYFDLFTENTAGRPGPVHEGYNIPDPCQALWPRLLDLGASP